MRKTERGTDRQRKGGMGGGRERERRRRDIQRDRQTGRQRQREYNVITRMISRERERALQCHYKNN